MVLEWFKYIAFIAHFISVIIGGGLVPKLCPSLATQWTVVLQAPLSMEFPRREYWIGLPFPPPGDLLDTGIETTSTALAGKFFTIEPPGKPLYYYYIVIYNDIIIQLTVM